jgi:hypothetical protein
MPMILNGNSIIWPDNTFQANSAHRAHGVAYNYETNSHAYYNSTGMIATNIVTPTLTISSNSNMYIWITIANEGNHEQQWYIYRSANGGSFTPASAITSSSANYGIGQFHGTHDADTNSTLNVTHGFLIDSPNATTVAYKIYLNRPQGPGVYINRTHGGSPYQTGVSRIMMIERRPDSNNSWS